MGYDWWQPTYEDASTIGLKLTGFDLDRNLHAEGEFEREVGTVIASVFENHGEQCETYQTAKRYHTKLLALKLGDEAKGEDDYPSAEFEQLCSDFLKDLLHDYAHMLQREYEYLNSDEHVDEMIRNHEYEFNEGGSRA